MKQFTAGGEVVYRSLYRILTRQNDITKQEVRAALAYITTLQLIYDTQLEHDLHDALGSELGALLHAIKSYCSYTSHGSYYSITAWTDRVRGTREEDPQQYTYPHIELRGTAL